MSSPTQSPSTGQAAVHSAVSEVSRGQSQLLQLLDPFSSNQQHEKCPTRSARTHQVIWPRRFVTLKTERHDGRARSLYSFTSCSLKSLDSLNHECHPEQMSLCQIAPAVHPRGRHRVWEILAFQSPLLRLNVTIWMRLIMSQP